MLVIYPFFVVSSELLSNVSLYLSLYRSLYLSFIWAGSLMIGPLRVCYHQRPNINK